MWLRECLVNDINSGKYPVGSLLPPESQLVKTYGVSRHTVREATRKLADTGLISRHPGIGTVVCGNDAATPYVAALGSLQELYDYTNTTRLELLSAALIVADAKLSAALGCEPNSEWTELRTRRHATGQVAPISFTRVYLRPEFSGIKDRLHGQHMSIFAMLERFYDQEICTVRQEIQASLMPADAAKLLGVKVRSAALLMSRAYSNANGRVIGVSSNLYVPERFHLVTSWNKNTEAETSPLKKADM